ncbi:MAG: glutamate racemase [Cyclobacteriaceae bacterium]
MLNFTRILMNKVLILLLCIGLYTACNNGENQKNLSKENAQIPIVSSILEDKESFYYIDFANYPQMESSLPIGVFDSGTGGLTVLDALVRFDEFNNDQLAEGSDGMPDFSRERFIYLADQANMPYGNYSSEKNVDLLVEHIIKDTHFLLSDKYYAQVQGDELIKKQPVKTIVIACNTATAYGKETIEEFLQKTGIEIKVIGVIDAGVRGALEVFEKEGGHGSIGVLATVGTISSGGYEQTIFKLKEHNGYSGNIQVFNQGGHGIAEAVDAEPDYIKFALKKPREDYRGPGLNHAEFPIEKSLLDAYQFDFSNGKVLCDTEQVDACQILQLNDAENYMRYHLVSLLEQMRKAENAEPLKALILGCTHYPYLTQEIRKILNELYDFKDGDAFRYRHLMHEKIEIIDPAVNVARELFYYLKEKNMFNATGDMAESQFFISVPNVGNPNAKLDADGRFTYEYKYQRVPGEIQEYVKVVPFSHQNIPVETISRLAGTIPATYSLIREFQKPNSTEGDLSLKAKVPDQ